MGLFYALKISNDMKMTIKIIFAVILTIATLYLVFGFVINDYNATRWSMDARFFLAMLSFILSYIAAGVVYFKIQ